MSKDLRAVAEQPQAVAVVTECEACFTPDVCQLRGTCDHYSAEWLRVAPPPPAAAPSEATDEATILALIAERDALRRERDSAMVERDGPGGVVRGGGEAGR